MSVDHMLAYFKAIEIIDPNEVLLAVTCDDFAFGQDDTNNDHCRVDQHHRRRRQAVKSFQGYGMVRRKNLPSSSAHKILLE